MRGGGSGCGPLSLDDRVSETQTRAAGVYNSLATQLPCHGQLGMGKKLAHNTNTQIHTIQIQTQMKIPRPWDDSVSETQTCLVLHSYVISFTVLTASGPAVVAKFYLDL